ncbi:glycosyltransferase family 4 protein [Sphaerisporangium rubeum]|uniref:Glycosyltransferase involved in cell wall biosynthesis n=1 Tax=Sphaerisporangium rubeum TaxID=321317 RepID=A0A7X0M6M3_9ACTN|nr:glycosyltransferase family 4 protein [Sphaerisporangium rubeum]MBB6472129.1 glycosyltransferase involved in cell wall biosynthesis [Sphaerisporangium rubeum]
MPVREVVLSAPGWPPGLAGRRVAVVNWRDPWHRSAGGAEAYAWEIGRRLAEQGAEVTFVTARDEGQTRADRVDGIDIVRIGGVFTVYPRVLAWLARRRFDAVIDCQNGIPFFTPWVVPRRVPVVCVMHHVHDAQFGVHFPGWMARAGRFLEGPVARHVYRNRVCAAVSPSTVAAMRDRLGWTGPIHVVPNGGDPPVPAPAPPSEQPSLVCVGRLVAHKRVERIIEAAAALRAEWPGLVLHIVGRGPEEDRLRRTAADLGDTVRFHGFVGAHEKARLVASSWLHLSASQGEGWGLSVLEAAALGVPTVAYDVDGLRDAVRDGRTGRLVRHGESLETVAGAMLKDVAARRAEIAAECRAWSSRFGWDESTRRMARLLTLTDVGDGEAYVVRYRTAATERAVVVECTTPERIRAAGLGEILEIRAAGPQEVLLGEPC